MVSKEHARPGEEVFVVVRTTFSSKEGRALFGPSWRSKVIRGVVTDVVRKARARTVRLDGLEDERKVASRNLWSSRKAALMSLSEIDRKSGSESWHIEHGTEADLHAERDLVHCEPPEDRVHSDHNYAQGHGVHENENMEDESCDNNNNNSSTNRKSSTVRSVSNESGLEGSSTSHGGKQNSVSLKNKSRSGNNSGNEVNFSESRVRDSVYNAPTPSGHSRSPQPPSASSSSSSLGSLITFPTLPPKDAEAEDSSSAEPYGNHGSAKRRKITHTDMTDNSIVELGQGEPPAVAQEGHANLESSSSSSSSANHLNDGASLNSIVNTHHHLEDAIHGDQLAENDGVRWEIKELSEEENSRAGPDEFDISNNEDNDLSGCASVRLEWPDRNSDMHERRPIDYFKFFFLTSSYLKELIESTNVNLRNVGEEPLKGENELFRFCGILLNMSLFNGVEPADLWSGKSMSFMNYPNFSNVLPFRRFRAIVTALAFSDTSPGALPEEIEHSSTLESSKSSDKSNSLSGSSQSDSSVTALHKQAGFQRFIESVNASRTPLIQPNMRLICGPLDDRSRCPGFSSLSNTQFTPHHNEPELDHIPQFLGNERVPIGCGLHGIFCAQTGILLRIEAVGDAWAPGQLYHDPENSFGSLLIQRLMTSFQSSKPRLVICDPIYAGIKTALSLKHIYDIPFVGALSGYAAVPSVPLIRPLRQGPRSKISRSYHANTEGVHLQVHEPTAKTPFLVLTTLLEHPPMKVLSGLEIPRLHHKFRSFYLPLQDLKIGQRWEIGLFSTILSVCFTDAYFALRYFCPKNSIRYAASFDDFRFILIAQLCKCGSDKNSQLARPALSLQKRPMASLGDNISQPPPSQGDLSVEIVNDSGNHGIGSSHNGTITDDQNAPLPPPKGAKLHASSLEAATAVLETSQGASPSANLIDPVNVSTFQNSQNVAEHSSFPEPFSQDSQASTIVSRIWRPKMILEQLSALNREYKLWRDPYPNPRCKDCVKLNNSPVHRGSKHCIICTNDAKASAGAIALIGRHVHVICKKCEANHVALHHHMQGV